MYVIDSNILIAILIDEPKAKECIKLFQKIENLELQGIVTSYTIHTLEIFGVRFKKFNKIKQFLEYLQSFENLQIYNTSIAEEIEIIEECEKTKLDFDDGLHYYVVKELNCDGIISYDKDFDKTDIKRVTPEGIIG